MTNLYAFEGHAPAVDPTAWIAPNACLVGRVEIEESVAVLFGAVLRADNNLIRIGAGSNVQDGTIIHCDPPSVPGGQPVLIGRRVTIGHGARLHGCTVGDGCMIGVGAVVLDGAVIGAGSLVAANAFVPPRMQIPEGSLVLGSPAVVKREVRDKDREMLALAAEMYVELGGRLRAGLVPLPPHSAPLPKTTTNKSV